MEYAIITENDISHWDDRTGLIYHFPHRYLNILKPGTKVIYYKGRMTDKRFSGLRLSKNPHYFGIAEIGKISNEAKTTNYFAEITNFRMFDKAVDFKFKNTPLEEIPQNKARNYWRDGVRKISKEIYNKIVENSNMQRIDNIQIYTDNEIGEEEYTSIEYEGGAKSVFSTKYERNKVLRDKAIKIHGYTCIACNFNFKDHYGQWGEGYIHVHHLKPVSSNSKIYKELVNPKTDLVVVCANCHSMIHRRKDKILSINELKKIILKNGVRKY